MGNSGQIGWSELCAGWLWNFADSLFNHFVDDGASPFTLGIFSVCVPGRKGSAEGF